VSLLLIEHGEPFIKYRHDDQILDSISDLPSNGYLWRRVELQRMSFLGLWRSGRLWQRIPKERGPQSRQFCRPEAIFVGTTLVGFSGCVIRTFNMEAELREFVASMK
jgi:hypothetical protein